MHAKKVLEKVAADIQSPAVHVSNWALPEQEALPLDSAEYTRRSDVEFGKQAHKIPAVEKLAAARRIDKALTSHGLERRGLATKMASDRLSPFFRAFISMRKEATAHLYDVDLDKLVKSADEIEKFAPVLRVAGLDKVARALEAFDQHAGIVDHVPDAAYSVYGSTLFPDEPLVEDRVKVASFDIGANDLEGVNWDAMPDSLEESVIEGMRTATDKLAVFRSLPMPHREIIAQSLRG